MKEVSIKDANILYGDRTTAYDELRTIFKF